MVVECDGVAILEACSPVAFPLRLKPRIIEQREALLENDAFDRAEALEAMAEEEASEPGTVSNGLPPQGRPRALPAPGRPRVPGAGKRVPRTCA